MPTMFFASRTRRGRDRYLAWKMASLFVGIGVGLVGISLESAMIVNIAIGVILTGIALRLLPRDRASSAESNRRIDE